MGLPAGNQGGPARRRILFVDDEVALLHGVTRLLRSVREDWEVACAENGPQALALLEQQPFELIVSDMRMPGMSGVELLTAVKARHPGIIRFILSGNTDRDLVLRCVSLAHQFLAKPCEPDQLIQSIQRAFDLGRFLDDAARAAVAARVGTLPSLPALYQELIGLLQSSHAGTHEVATVVARDPALTAKLLQLANSAYFGFAREISHPAEAVSMLGVELVRSLMLGFQAFATLHPRDARKEELDRLWLHSLRTANVARRIAKLEHEDPPVQDECFTAGLLHDIGQLLRLGARPKTSDPTPALSGSPDADAAELGGYLLGLWGLPLPIVEAVAFHPQPAGGGVQMFSPLTAVHVADCLDREFTAVPGVDPGPAVDLAYLGQIGKAGQLDEWRRSAGQFYGRDAAAAA